VSQIRMLKWMVFLTSFSIIFGSTSLLVPAEATNSLSVISEGYNFSCALSDGTVQCWGSNWSGQLGDGTLVDRNTPVAVLGISGVTDLAAGGDHACALMADATVDCWGKNGSGQIGNATFVDSTTPLPVSFLTNVSAIASGYDHSCALINDGTVKCWGNNFSGQLGDGTNASSNVPVTVTGLTNVISLGARGNHTCALIGDQSVKCWGDNGSGELGDGAFSDSTAPVTVLSLTNATSIALGSLHSCALISGGTVKCWGYNRNGQLGDGTNTTSSTAVSVLGLTDIKMIAARGEHSCAIHLSGTVSCWGKNGNGELGDGTTSNRSTPVAVSGLTNATSIAAGYFHSCALLTTGSVNCWGSNIFGQLGNGSTGGSIPTPVSVLGAGGVGYLILVMPDSHIRVIASINSLNYVDGGSGTSGTIRWTGKNIDLVLFTGSACNYPTPNVYGSLTSSWDGSIINLRPGKTYHVTLEARSVDNLGEAKALDFTTSASTQSGSGDQSAAPAFNLSCVKTLSATPLAVTGSVPQIVDLVSKIVSNPIEAGILTRLVTKLDTAKILPVIHQVLLPHSRLVTTTATSLTPDICQVQENVLHGLKSGKCTVSYLLVGKSGNSFTTSREFLF
jgi:alpha-tubulin suppressor-like RCC1 family protein